MPVGIDDIDWITEQFVHLQKNLVRTNDEVARTKQSYAHSLDALILGILEVLDLGERLEKEPDCGPYLHKLTKKIAALLKGNGVRVIETLTVDPAFVRVLETRSCSEKPDGTVLEICRKGYIRGDKVLRPQDVITSRLVPPNQNT